MKSKFCATSISRACAIAHLPGAAGRERVVDANGRQQRIGRRRQRRIDHREAELAEHLLADHAGRAHAEDVGAVVDGVGALGQVEIADAEVAAIVLPARVLGLELAARAQLLLDARHEVHRVGRHRGQAR